jgi:putative membrane protein insertion efficiency factor
MSAPMRPELWPRQVLAALVRGYRLLLKPWLGNACRFEPTCSSYALEALERHGALGGSALAGWRLLRCHPWCAGGVDPVPERLRDAYPHRGSGLFTRLVPGGRRRPSRAAGASDPHPPIEPRRRVFHRPGARSGEPT